MKFENTEVFGIEAAIRGMRNAKNSWDKSDSFFGCKSGDYGRTEARYCNKSCKIDCEFCIGMNDLRLMKSLVKGGQPHRKFLRMIHVQTDIVAPAYWWSECDTYKVSTVRNSCSIQHTGARKDYEISDFTIEIDSLDGEEYVEFITTVTSIMAEVNNLRRRYKETGDYKYFRLMRQIMPMGFNYRSTYDCTYETLAIMYQFRENHPLSEWSKSFVEWIETLPYSFLITGKEQ